MDNSGGRKTWGFVALLVIGAIIAFLLSYIQTNNVSQAFVSTITLIMAGVLARIVMGLAEKAAAPLSDFINNNLLASHRKPYLQYLIFKYRYFETRGLSAQPEFNLELSQLFVDLDLHKRSRDNPINGDKGIWYWLEHENSNQVSKLVLLGAPGSGKTTLMKQIALVLAKGEKVKVSKKILNKTPILLFLRDLEKPINADSNITLSDIVVSTIKEMPTIPPSNWFRRMLSKGNCIVMLDGLDEIADDQARQKVVDWVQEQIRFYNKNIFIVTSRPFGYENNQLSGVTALKITPYSREKVEIFIHNWYLANEIAKSNGRDDPGIRWTAKNSAEDLIQRLGIKPALSALAVNPLLLTMITTVHSMKEQLPGRRVELFRDIFEVTFEKRNRFVWSQNNLNTPQKLDVLRTLAYNMMTNEMRTISKSQAVSTIIPDLQNVGSKLGGEEFLNSIENDSGLLLEIENGKYGFAHFTFQEYLASTYIINDRTGESEKRLLGCVGETWWSETILLYSAQTDATKIVEKCLEKGTYNSLGLATDCLDEALKIDSALRDKLENVLNEKMESDDENVRAMVSKAKLASRLRWMVRIDEKTYIDSTPITNIEYQMFLDEMRKVGKYYYPDHWLNERFPAFEGLKPITGIRPDDASDYCKWLTGRDIWSANYMLPRKKDVSSQTIGDQVYWIIDDNGRKIPHPHQNAVIEVTEENIIDLLERDYYKAKIESAKIETEDRPRPTTEVLLGRKPYMPRAATMAEKSLGIAERTLEIKSLEEFKAHIIINQVNEFKNIFSVDFIKVIGFAELIYSKFADSINVYLSSLLNESKPFYFKAGMNLVSSYIDVDNILSGSAIYEEIDYHYRFLVPTLKSAIYLLINRKWIEIPSDDRGECYDQLRWCTRLCVTLLMHAIDLKNIKNDIAINSLRDLIIDLVVLENRIMGEFVSFEGVRLIKEIPSRI